MRKTLTLAGSLIIVFAMPLAAQEAPIVESAPPDRCPDAMTTRDMDECFAGVLQRAESRRGEYLAAALERHADRPELTEKIRASDTVFTAYRDAECAAVLEDWIEGTIRGVMSLTCRIELTDRRTRTIWQNWLTYMDSTSPVLPEPGPTE